MTALVMDDNTASRNIISDMLADWRVAAEQAADMETACTMARMAADKNKPYQIYLIDAEMPEDDGIGFAQWLIESGLPDYVSILMVPYSRLRAEINASSLPVNASISKPIRMQELLNALLIATDFPKAMGTTSAETSEGDTEEASALHILVVEDTPFNQKFVLRLLGRWGHTADVADNGRIALELLAPGKYDVILMDVQMPEMDGFEATEAIRERQYADGWGHIPIIAMTAHAMKGDQERCLEVGMDAYVSKPISSELLRDTINDLVSRSGETGPPGETTPDEGDAINKESMLRAFDHDWEFFQEAVDMFVEDYPPMIDHIRQAIQEADTEKLKRNAHALKGMLGNFQATAAAKAALVLEDMGREQHLDGASEAEAQLSTEVARVEQTLRAMLEESN
jgi:CheY-like chemotaxis protein